MAENKTEKYELKNPGGSKQDAKLINAFSEAAQEIGLSQEAAQKFLDKMAPILSEHLSEQAREVQKGWHTSSAADKEFGGEKLKENLAIATKALDHLDSIPRGEKTTPLRTLLQETGLGSHPELVRLLIRAGKAIRGDKSGGKSNADATSVLYDNTKER